MPFIVTKVSTPLTDVQERELKERFGHAIAQVIAEIAREAGIGEDAFELALTDGSAETALVADARLAARVGVRSLPAFLIESRNGATLLHGVPVCSELEEAVERALSAS